MINKQQTIPSMLLALVMLVLASAAVADVAVITNKSSTVASLSADEVKALFLQKVKTFPEGGAVVLGDQSDKSAVRNEFGKQVLGKSSKKLKRYWSKRVFSGKGVPPKVIGDDAAMKAWVANTKNSLGYINAEALDDTVKVLFKK